MIWALPSRAVRLVLISSCCCPVFANTANQLLYALPIPAPQWEQILLRRTSPSAVELLHPAGKYVPRAFRATVTSFQRRLSDVGTPPYILKLRQIHLPSAQGNDQFHSSVGNMEVAIALSIGVSSSKVKGVALLVYRDRTAATEESLGYLVLLFVVDFDSCVFNMSTCHSMQLEEWSEALRNSTSPINLAYKGKVDRGFPHYLTPALCDQWEIRGPGCNSAVPIGPYVEDRNGLPLWFVMGLGTTAVILCAMYPVYRAVQARHLGRHNARETPAETHTSLEALEAELRDLHRERVSLTHLKEDDTCPICLAKPEDDITENLFMPPCRHCMHVSCAQAWLLKHLQCPLCRRAFRVADCAIWELELPPGHSSGEGMSPPSPSSSGAAGEVDAVSGSACSSASNSDESVPGDTSASLEQHPAVAVLRMLKDDIENIKLEEVRKDIVDNASAELGGEGQVSPLPTSKSHLTSDPRSPIAGLSVQPAVLGAPEVQTPTAQPVARSEAT